MSLRARILVLVLAACLLPVLAMLWLLLEYREATVASAHEQLVSHVDVIAEDLEDKIAGSSQLLFGLGRVPVVGGPDKAACSEFLAEVLKAHPQYTGLLTILPDGNLHCDSLRTGRSLNLKDRGYFKLVTRSSTPVVEPVIGRLSGKGVLQIAYPVRAADGSLKFILLASLDFDFYGHAVVQGLPYPRMHFQMWNRDGSIVMDMPGPGAGKMEPDEAGRRFMLSSSSERTQSVGHGAEARIWAKARLPRTQDAGLALALNVPEAEVRAAIDQQFKRAMGWLIGIAVVIFTGGALLGEFAIRRQAARLIEAISRMDAGDYSPAGAEAYPRGELGQVMQALDRMAASLAQQRQELAHNTAALERQARIDPLTNLANRHMLTSRLEQAIDWARRTNRVAGVLMLDLDRFKTVNDSLGHQYGDQLLQEVAHRLTHCVREGDTVARLGGDEFVVVLADMANVADIEIVAQKILGALAHPVEVGLQVLSISTSLGIAVYPRDGDSVDALLQQADTAMYRAKDQGGNALAFFSPEMMQAMMERLQIEAGLRIALERGELRLHYQPIIDAQSGRIVSAEALVRWQHPERGIVPPVQFIPIAEETGLIDLIGHWVLHEACRRARVWRDEGLGDIPVAVNLAPCQFGAPTLADSISKALEATRCPAELLQLEITESSVMSKVEQALETMHQLKALGIQLSIDDFGTGYSSLSQLKQLPVSTLKIDRSFVRDIQVDGNDDILVDAIITLARKLGLSTVAEGVETQEQLTFLQAKGCDKYQGYYFSRPLEADAFEQFVRERNGVNAI